MSNGKARETAAPAVDRPAAVYRLYDEAGVLLYVGSSFDPEERCKGHREKPWWQTVANRTEEWHPTRERAFAVELEAIVREAPAHNIYGTGRTTEAMRERQAKNRARGAVQREAVYLHRAVHDEAVAEGASYREAWNRADVAEIDFLDSSGLFPAYVERLRQHVRYLYGQGNQQGRSHD